MGTPLGPKYVMYKYTYPLGVLPLLGWTIARANTERKHTKHCSTWWSRNPKKQGLHVREPHVRRPFGDLRDYRAAQDMSFGILGILSSRPSRKSGCYSLKRRTPPVNAGHPTLAEDVIILPLL